MLLEVAYAGGLRISEILALNWSDVLPRDQGRVQLSVTGKGGKVRQVLLPEIVSRSLLSLRGDAGANVPVFVSQKGGRMTERAVHHMLKATAKKAGINEAVSPHWLRHAHGSHAIERGAAPICATSLAGPSRSRRAISDACRLAGTASAGDGAAATVRGRPFDLPIESLQSHFQWVGC